MINDMKVLVLLTKFLKYIILIAVSVYLLLNILLFFFQEKLLFFPSSPYIPHYEKIRANPTLKNYIIKTPDGYILDGWMQIDKKNEKTILYFGGN
jgi:hypothetical protein